MGNRKLHGFLAGIAASSIWGGMYVVSKVVLEHIPPFSLLSLRLLLGILVLAVIVMFRPRISLSKQHVTTMLVVGFVGFGISLGFQFIGTDLSTAANASLVTSATPAFVFVFAAWLLNEPITINRLFALLVSTLGVLIIVDPFSAGLSADMLWGNISLVFAGVTWALYSVLMRKYGQRIPILNASLIALAGGLIVSIPLGLHETNRMVWWPVNEAIIVGVLYLGIVSTALAFYLWNKAFEILEAGPAGLTFFAQPIVGALLGWRFLDEDLDAKFLFGGVMILIGIWLVSVES